MVAIDESQLSLQAGAGMAERHTHYLHLYVCTRIHTCIDSFSPSLFLSLCSVVLYACGFSCVIQNAQSNRRISCPLNVFGNIFDTYCMYSMCMEGEYSRIAIQYIVQISLAKQRVCVLIRGVS